MDELLTIQDVVRLTKLSASTIKRCLTRPYRRLPSLRIEGRRRIRLRDLNRWVEEAENRPAEMKAAATEIVQKMAVR